MDFETKRENDTLVFYIRGEIDHHRTLSLREQMDFAILRELPARVVLDLSETQFCDSSALGLILGRVRVCAQCDSTLFVQNPSARVRKILDLAGAQKYLKFTEGERT